MSFLLSDFPHEILVHIFGFLRHKNDRRHTALVCKPFQQIVRQQSRNHQTLRALGPKRLIALKTFINLDPIPFKRLALEVDSTDIDPMMGLCANYGLAIEHLSLHCNFGNDFFNKMHDKVVETFPNLKTLEIKLNGKNDPKRYSHHWWKGNEIPIGVVIGKKMFSSSLQDLKIVWVWSSLDTLDHFLNLFPGLKRLELAIEDHFDAVELRKLMEKWLCKLELVEIRARSAESMYEAFADANYEKLVFNEIRAGIRDDQDMALFKRFFVHSRRIRNLYFVDRPITRNLLELIKRNCTVDCLHVDRLKINIKRLEGIIHSENVKEIELLNVNESLMNVNFTPDALLKVKRLEILGWKLRNGSEFIFPAFQQLKSLTITSMIKNRELKEFIENCPLLEKFEALGFFAKYSESEQDSASFSALKNLIYLDLSNAPYLCDDFLLHGFQLPELQTLTIGRANKITSVGIKSLTKNCPKLEEVALKFCNQIDDENIKFLIKELPYLRHLNVAGCCVEDSKIDEISKMYPELFITNKICTRLC